MPDIPAVPKPTSKPTVTDDHLKRLDKIMGTSVKSNAPTPPTVRPEPPEMSKGLSILNNIPKPSGLGNKMFIFTGKKKIIIDGTEKEEEKIKTVDAKPPKKEEEKKAPPPTPPPTVAPPPANVPTIIISKNKPEEKHDDKKAEPKKAESSIQMGVKSEVKKEKAPSTSGGKKIPTIVIVLFGVVFLGAWTVFWLVFFGFVKL